MPIAPPSTCNHPGCIVPAITGSIYCAEHQTKDSKSNRVRRKPVRKVGSAFITAADPEAVEAALADGENLDEIQIPGQTQAGNPTTT